MSLNEFSYQIEKLRTSDISSTFHVPTVLKDLFSLLYDTLWALNTPLRKFVVFQKNINLSTEQLVFNKPDIFSKQILSSSGVNIIFEGELRTYANGPEISSYVENIVYGYVNNEKTLVVNLRKVLPALIYSASSHGINLNTADIPIMHGVYHSHKLKFKENKDITHISAVSKLSLFL